MMRCRSKFCGWCGVILAFVVFLVAPPLRAAPASPSTNETLSDADLDRVEVYLHTIDVGNMIYDNFGHTALRVIDHKRYRDIVYNWGMFEVSDPLSFALNFYRGQLNYKLGAYPYTAAIRGYKADGRTVWEDKLNLSLEEKKILLARLHWNMQPENQYYPYQYFFDNCSTRPRDYLDEALGGVLRGHYHRTISNRTYRDFVMDGYASDPGMDVLLDFGMNSNLDRFATQWETMFHPLFLRSVLMDYSQNQRPLISESQVLVEFPKKPIYPKLAYSFFLLFGGVPLIPLVFGLFVQQNRAQPATWLYRIFGALGSGWFFFGGFFGFLMALSWAVSGHLDLHHNANMLLFWPCDGLVFAGFFVMMVKGRPLQLRPRVWMAARAYLLLHIVISLLLPCLRMIGLIEQNVDRVSVYLLPPYVVLLLLMFRVGLRKR